MLIFPRREYGCSSNVFDFIYRTVTVVVLWGESNREIIYMGNGNRKKNPEAVLGKVST